VVGNGGIKVAGHEDEDPPRIDEYSFTVYFDDSGGQYYIDGDDDTFYRDDNGNAFYYDDTGKVVYHTPVDPPEMWAKTETDVPITG
jgi:hypothetical protein